ncbi:hypothetical protein G6F31_019224 [Rhizopus arrhizus]|nr:hypothetical protein G6F31_019224 [Rhizopus arrhizus]
MASFSRSSARATATLTSPGAEMVRSNPTRWPPSHFSIGLPSSSNRTFPQRSVLMTNRASLPAFLHNGLPVGEKPFPSFSITSRVTGCPSRPSSAARLPPQLSVCRGSGPLPT